jgi:acyl-coenzyme A thioesterase PaaI-like protein
MFSPLDGRLFGEGQPCFGCGPDHPHGFRLVFSREDDEVVTTFTPGVHHQGPPGIMHGGLVATLADEVAAWSVIALLSKFGFTGSFGGKLHKPVRIGRPVVARGRISKGGTRVVESAVRLTQDDVEVFTGDFRFVLLDRAGAERILGGPIPEAWEPFCR